MPSHSKKADAQRALLPASTGNSANCGIRNNNYHRPTAAIISDVAGTSIGRIRAYNGESNGKENENEMETGITRFTGGILR